MTIGLPSWDEFQTATRNASIVALSTTINFDLETAIALADRFVKEEHFFLLESATPGPGGLSRYSFLGFDALAKYEADGNDLSWTFGHQRVREPLNGRDPLQVLATLHAPLKVKVLQATKQRQDVLDLCYSGGFVGYISYDAARYFEPKAQQPLQKQFGMPEIFFMLPKNFLVLDQLSRKLTVIRYSRVDGLNGDALRRVYAEELKAFGGLLNKIKTPHRVEELIVREEPVNYDDFTASISEQTFYRFVEQGLQEIRNGEIYQIQLGNRLSKKTAAEPFHVFRHLRILNPSPYMAFYKLGEHHIICASPEMMVNVQDQKVVHRPIAGTRRRTWDPNKDPGIKNELLNDQKERAEHVMLVDLARNDIGRISAPGSVSVDELMIVEEYSHVFHLVSQVSGKLKPTETAFSAMTASFPNGTVTGAPKIRSMQLISRIEPVAREFYAGSLGLFDFNGNLRSTLLIRTIYMGGGMAATQASAGIVYDSIPHHEWQETRNKMAACLLAIQNTMPLP